MPKLSTAKDYQLDRRLREIKAEKKALDAEEKRILGEKEKRSRRRAA